MIALKRNLSLAIAISWVLNLNARDVNVREFGAVGDGKTMNSTFLQKAIDECHASGGGKVIFPEGVYLSGTIAMKDNVILHFQKRFPVTGKYQYR